ncbi:MAG TPA: MFS transporter [Verrucomicrobiae bacterium]|nr:MFS transporter [Verrucomicrobiae bacterium]
MQEPLSTPSAPSLVPGQVSDTAAPPLVVSERKRWTIVWLLFAASLINYFDRQTLAYSLPLLAKDFDLNKAQQGWVLSTFFWTYTILQIPVGLCVDRFNLRWLYAGAFVIWSVAQGLTGFANSLTMLIGCRFLLGVGEAIYLTGGTKVVSLFFPLSQRGLPCGLFDAGTRTGLVLEGLTIGLLISAFGWRTTFALVGFAALLWLIPWFAATPAQMRDTSADATRTRFSWDQLGHLLRNRDLWGVLLGFFCFDYYWYFLIMWLPSYFVDVHGVKILEAGIRAALPFLVFGVCQPTGGWIADYLIRRGWDPARARKVIITAAFLSGLLIIPAAYTTNKNVALVLIACGCLVGLSTANQLVLLQGCTPPKEIGLAVGVYNFVGNLAGVMGPVITGAVIMLSGGSYTLAFIVPAVMMAASSLAYWFIVGPMREQNAAVGGS